ncbi:Phage P2 baseplate assembly gpV-like protein [Novosphingobium nitrogenifigens DSM 19370]|uniref:Phage P2 baseplate assembly gpV-like protein n=1 Tax=Novosphingobium nitrogenifigens DSM 19370 TaxID=983920 RepID=F1Z9C2_9SPHN|nr:phage baseplate assembly protein V [Novosphingobium nitrogenifigens]EGD58383.1 Phage P2 baseplate assembly gpV-like protein [Novosphingobium nitrogenifigens DSM 19370]
MAMLCEPATDPDRLIRFGAVAAVDLAGALCTVELDDGVVSGPLRWIEMRAGRTRTWSPPSQGEQVVLLCPGGEIGAGVVLRGVVSDAFPPAGDSLIEILGEYADGARLSYDAEAHALVFALPAGGLFTVLGDVHVTGTLTADGDVVAGGISGKGHRHATPSGMSEGPQ